LRSAVGVPIRARRGRLPTWPDVTTNPPGVVDVLQQKKIIPAIFSGDAQKKWQAAMNEMFRRR